MMRTLEIVLGIILVTLIHALYVLILRPRLLRAKLHRQGIHGPSPHFYFGNIPEMKSLLLSATQTQSKENGDVSSASISHNWHSTLFPHFHKWRKQYGQFLFFCPVIYNMSPCLISFQQIIIIFLRSMSLFQIYIKKYFYF